MAYRSRGVRAVVHLQMAEMERLLVVWKQARRLGVRLPATRDPAYQDLDTLLRHPLRSCRGYLTWLCEVLGRPEPRLPEPPAPERVAAEAASYLEVLARAWARHMAWMTDRTFQSRKVHVSRWGAPMTVEAMLEHAAVHPMRHRFQLEELIAKRRRARAGHARATPPASSKRR